MQSNGSPLLDLARTCFEDAFRRRCYCLLQNCHLVIPWLPELINMIENIDPDPDREGKVSRIPILFPLLDSCVLAERCEKESLWIPASFFLSCTRVVLSFFRGFISMLSLPFPFFVCLVYTPADTHRKSRLDSFSLRKHPSTFPWNFLKGA